MSSIFANRVEFFNRTRKVARTGFKVKPAPRRGTADRWTNPPAWVDAPLGSLGFSLTPHPPARADSQGSGGMFEPISNGEHRPLADLHARTLAAQDASATFDESEVDDDATSFRLARDEQDALVELALAIAHAGGFDWTPVSLADEERRTTLPLASVHEGGKVYIIVDGSEDPGSVEIERDGETFTVRPVVI